MKNLRSTGGGPEASSHLAQLNLGTRAQQLVSTGANDAASAHRALTSEDDLQDGAEGQAHQASSTLTRPLGRPGSKGPGSGRDPDGRDPADRDTDGRDPADRDTDGRDPAIRDPDGRGPSGRRPGTTSRTKGGAGTPSGRKPAAKAGGALRNQQLSRPMKGGIVARIRRTSTSKKGAKAAVQAGTSASRAAIAAARTAAVVAHVVRAAIASAITALSSTPVLLTIAVAVGAVIAVILAVGWLIPGVEHERQRSNGVGVPGSFALVDDYPYKSKYRTATGYSPMGYAWGNCTDFAAWRVNRDAGVKGEPWKFVWAGLTPKGGHGGQWGLPGNLPGWHVTRTPVPGDIISISRAGVLSTSGRGYGHVAYIAAVDSSGTITIENYGNGRYYLTSATASELRGYIDSGAAVVKHNPKGRVGGLPDGDADGDAKAYALEALADEEEFACLDKLWIGESGWNHRAENPSSGSYGIPQALPADKMKSAGDDWRDNPITQVKWGLTYISERYGTPCKAWNFWQGQSPHWY